MMVNPEKFKEQHLDDQGFRDMRLRIINGRGCTHPPRQLVPIVHRRPGDSWPYGVLLLWRDEKEVGRATFGDLTIPISWEEAFVLQDMASNPHSLFVNQW